MIDLSNIVTAQVLYGCEWIQHLVFGWFEIDWEDNLKQFKWWFFVICFNWMQLPDVFLAKYSNKSINRIINYFRNNGVFLLSS